MTRKGFRNFFVVPRTWRARFGVFLGGLCVLAACGVIRYCWGTAAAKAQVSAEPAPPNSAAAAMPEGSPQSARGARNAASAPLSSNTGNYGGRMQIPDVVASVN